MAKAFTTYHLVHGKEPILRHMVCEVRYRDGQLYLDHSGRLLRKLLQTSPEWVFGHEPSPKGTTIFNVVAGVTLSFSAQSVSLSMDKTGTDECIDQTEAEQFSRLADDALEMVFGELEVKEWSRIGFRELHYFSCDSKADTEKWLSELGLCSITPALFTSFKGRSDAIGFSLVIEGDDCSYRIALNGIERSAQVPVGETTLTVRSSALPEKQKEALRKALKKQRQRQINAAFAAVLDIDAYRDDPTDMDVGKFIRECSATNLERFRGALPATNGKKGK